MSPLLVSGLINIETTLQVDGFPIPYFPVHYPFFGIHTTVAGVGFNISKALHTLGNEVNFMSIVGDDYAARMVHETLTGQGISDQYIVSGMQHTAQSVILYDKTGRREIYTDLKDIQERAYPEEIFDQALRSCPVAVLCNINFSRPFLQKAKRAGAFIATDVHTPSQLDDPYNTDFMRAADILFMSDEKLPCSPEEWARKVQGAYNNEILVIGLGAEGALLSVRTDRFIERIPAVATRPVVNSIGAGDALFSCFVHVYHQTRDPYEAIRKAVVFASWKIGEPGAADGFLDRVELDQLYSTKIGRS
jgi:sugar/nucleoside kinase (ribokinase family)